MSSELNKKVQPKLWGGYGDAWGKQFHQQNRIYDSNYVAMCHPANIHGGSYLYVVSKKRKKENL